MRELLEFLLKGILGDDNYSIEEEKEENHIRFLIDTEPENMGLIIGKRGKTIRTIRNLLRVRATLEKKGVSVAVVEKE
jgi:predicted RNA-binding protein YlqC (UPF0109 family)